MLDCFREFTLFSEAGVRSSLRTEVLYAEASGCYSSHVKHLSNMLAAWLWDTGHTGCSSSSLSPSGSSPGLETKSHICSSVSVSQPVSWRSLESHSDSSSCSIFRPNSWKRPGYFQHHFLATRLFVVAECEFESHAREHILLIQL